MSKTPYFIVAHSEMTDNEYYFVHHNPVTLKANIPIIEHFINQPHDIDTDVKFFQYLDQVGIKFYDGDYVMMTDGICIHMITDRF